MGYITDGQVPGFGRDLGIAAIVLSVIWGLIALGWWWGS